MRALVTGATGLLGRALLAKLSKAVVLSRDPSRANRLGPSVEMHGWRPEVETAPEEAFRRVDTIFHLAGEPVAEGRWTTEKKQRIRDSRILGTRNLVAALAAAPSPVKVLVSASAVGIYGDRGDEALDETSPAGSGFLADVCAGWEREAMAAEKLGVRVVCVRIGVVLAPNGGALGQMLTPFKLGLGGRLASGRPWMPWIHIDDVVGALLPAGRHDEIHGPMNATSPHPVTNIDFTQALAGALRRPAALAVPKTAVRLTFGEVSEVLLASQRVLPRVAERTAYEFTFPELSGALAAVTDAPPAGAAA